MMRRGGQDGPMMATKITLAQALALAEGHLQAGRLAEADGLCAQILAQDPNQGAALHLRGLTAFHRGRFEAAAEFLARARLANPGNVALLGALGAALERSGRAAEALAALDAALALDPEDAIANYNRGDILYRLGRLDEAAAALVRARAGMTGDARVVNALGAVRRDQGRLDEAERLYREAQTLDPASARPRYNLAQVLLAGGDFAAGWDVYEARRAVPEAASFGLVRGFPQPEWDGTVFSGGRLLVYGEQGVGEEIMFASMLPGLIAEGLAIILECDPRFVPLFARSLPAVEVVARSEPFDPRLAAPDIACQTPLGSLGRHLRRAADDFAGQQPYLVADPARIDACRQRYDDGRLIVGFSWRSGNPRNGYRRSIQIEQWDAVLAMPGVRFVNLQYGDCAAELAGVRARTGVAVMQDPEIDPLADLDGFAAQVAALDLVVSAANTTVHTAGGLGRPCWALFDNAPDWRWTNRSDVSHWYPTVRQLRQTTAMDWQPVLDEVARIIAAQRDGHGSA
jgi:Flp pilus assembly protein TadD